MNSGRAEELVVPTLLFYLRDKVGVANFLVAYWVRSEISATPKGLRFVRRLTLN